MPEIVDKWDGKKLYDQTITWCLVFETVDNLKWVCAMGYTRS